MKRDKTPQLIIGLALGLLFGFALQRAMVTDYEIILETLRLQDLRVLKVMMTAVAVGAIGIYAMRSLGLIELSIRPASVGRTVVGGLIFGIGFAILGYCPGTSVGAAAEGRMDALVGGIVGMLAGSFLFARMYPRVKPLSKLGDMGDKTLWQMLKLPPWPVVIGVCVAIVAILYGVESMGL
ncbi:MAG: YeeE/YedE family protein [Armatimonadia bacterium]|nr:YeeE/YedE family protein [Armatimonadia bacterium]